MPSDLRTTLIRTGSMATMATDAAGAKVVVSAASLTGDGATRELVWPGIGAKSVFAIQITAATTRRLTRRMPPLNTRAGSIGGPFGRFSPGRWNLGCGRWDDSDTEDSACAPPGSSAAQMRSTSGRQTP